jgi:hypothetical protein
VWSGTAPAQEVLSPPGTSAPAEAAASPARPAPVNSRDPGEMQSILFTYWEQTAIRDARRSRGLVRPPTEEELQRDLNKKPDGPKVAPPPEERYITLGGIV